MAQTCQALWTLINTKAPFLSQIIDEDVIFNLSPRLLALRLSFLASATEVQWLAVKQQSFLSLTVDEPISGSILRTISESTALQSLELTQVELSPYHQQVILRIPTLRKLTLCDSICVPTTETLPPTSIHVLVLRTLNFEQTAFEHLFQILAASLEILELGTKCLEKDVHKLYSILGSMRLRRFAGIRAVMPVLLRNLNHPFLFNSFITVLHIGAEEYSRSFTSGFPETFLPKLCHLSAPWRIAEFLIPGRPVRVYRDTELELIPMGIVESRLVQLATSASHIKELELRVSWSSPGIFNGIEKHLPHLMRLRLLVDPQTRYDPREWKKPMARVPKVGVKYTHLRQLELRMEIPPNTRQPHQISRPNCGKLSTLFILVCPSLEVLSFIITPNKFETNERDIPPRCIFKLRKTANGAWEERGFGIKMSEDVRGFPMVE